MEKGTRGEKSKLCWQQATDEEQSGNPTRHLRRLIIEVKAPWALDPVAFVQEDHLPTADELQSKQGSSYHPTKKQMSAAARGLFSEAQKIWAQIYDSCVTQGNYFFALTSYEFWVFGVFSADYTFAQVTDPIPYDSKKPTVLACLMYWTQSAMLVSGLHEIPWPLDDREPLAQIPATTLKDGSVLNLRAAKTIATVD
ncbi:hypothetical protein FRC01_014332 [Tulasnella sp. 417]|nr:hypothetical protein FRC01_014332 [Tulasnella sp. 417]